MADSTTSSYGSDRERQLAHLASSVSHHVINAFSAVVSNAEILKLCANSEADSELETTVDVIVNVSVKASGVARRLIDFTRPSTKPSNQSVDLAVLIQNSVTSFSKAYSNASWSIDCSIASPIVGDADQLRSMFDYILLNSVESLRPSGGHISIRFHSEDSEWMSIMIEDDGLGMDTNVQEQALEPFFSTKPGRLGIGLCLANSIWRRHGGTLSISSRPGKGTLLRLTYHHRT